MRDSSDEAEVLFWKHSISNVIAGQTHAIGKAVEELPAERIRNEAVDVLATEMIENFKIVAPVLKRNEISVSKPQEVDINVGRDYGRGGRPAKGVSVTFRIPYEGDKTLFYVQPNTYDSAPPRARVGRDALEVAFSGLDLKADSLKSEFERTLADIARYLSWQREAIDLFNAQVKEIALTQIHARTARLGKADDLVGSLGFKVV